MPTNKEKKVLLERATKALEFARAAYQQLGGLDAADIKEYDRKIYLILEGKDPNSQETPECLRQQQEELPFLDANGVEVETEDSHLPV